MVEHERSGVVDMVTWSFSRVAMWAPAFIVLIILYEVIFRYIVGSSVSWVNETSLWVAGGVYLTAGLYAMQQRSHIRIFILYDIAPLWLRRVFDLISLFCVFVFAFFVVWGGFNEAWSKFLRWERIGSFWNPPIPATLKPLILLLMVVLAIQALSNLIRDWPAHPAVRKTFDVLAFALIMAGVVAVLWFTVPYLVGAERVWGTVPMKVPTVWLWVMTLFVLAVAALAVLGLVRDFNRTPAPATLEHDPADEIDRDALGLPHEPDATLAEVAAPTEGAIPNETLSGNPPLPGKKNHP